MRAFYAAFFVVFFYVPSASALAATVPLKRHRFSEAFRKANLMKRLSLNVTADLDPLPSNYQKDGEYGIEVTIGSSGTFYLQLDTGSSDLGVASSKCFGCSKAKHLYKPSGSAMPQNCSWCDDHVTKETTLSCKTSRASPRTKMCDYEISYADNSGYSAALFRDEVAFDSKHRSQAYVGMIFEAKTFFDGVVDGIIGFAGRGESSANAPTPFELLVADGTVDANVFSLCLELSGGQLYLGDIDLIHDPATQWTTRVPGNDFYTVKVTDMLVDSQSIGIKPNVFNDGGAIIDSGTSDCCVPQPAFKALKKSFRSLCASTCLKGICNCATKKPLTSTIFENRCVDMSKEDMALFPNITVMMDGIPIEHRPEFYLQDGQVYCDNEDMYTISYSSCGASGSGSIFGDTFMQGFVTIHDIAGGRMGFHPRRADDACPQY